MEQMRLGVHRHRVGMVLGPKKGGEAVFLGILGATLRVQCLNQNGYGGPRFIFEKTYLENELKTQSGRIESIGPYCSTNGWVCGRDIGEGLGGRKEPYVMEVTEGTVKKETKKRTSKGSR